jgi:hypothetical protein
MKTTINNTYFIDTDFDFGYSNSWLKHTKHYYALYIQEGVYNRKIREYKDLSAICDSLISKYKKGILINTSYQDIVDFVNEMIKNNKIRRKKYMESD